MKTTLSITLASLCLLHTTVLAGHALVAGARYQNRHSQFTLLPFNDGDMTYQLGYEYKEGGGFWQLLVGYTPSVSDSPDGRGDGVESVLTPQLNLLFEDRNWLAGVGALASYIAYDEVDNDWTDVYWQVMFGYQIPLPAFHVELMVYYPFEKWKTFSDFETGDLEYGILLKRMF